MPRDRRAAPLALAALLAAGPLMHDGELRQVGAGLNRYYPAGLISATQTTVMILEPLDTLRALPLLFPRAGVIDSIACAVVAIGAAGSVARIGLYAGASSLDLAPATLVVDGGAFDGTVNGVKATAVNVTLRPDLLYWMVYVCGVAPPTLRAIDTLPSVASVWGVDGGTFGVGLEPPIGWSVAFPYAALPAVFPPGGAIHSTVQPSVCLGARFAA